MKLSELREIMRHAPGQIGEMDYAARAAFLRTLGLEPGALYQELEMESRYVDTHRDTSYSNSSVNLHSHTFYEVLCCRNTCGAEYLVGTERYRLQKGDIIFISPGISHRPLLPERLTEPYRRDVLWFSREFEDIIRALLADSFAGEKRATSLLRTAGTKWEYLAEMFHAGVREAEARQPGWEAALIGNTITLVTHLARAFYDRSVMYMKAEEPVLLDRVMAHVEAHLGERITLSDVAAQFYVSESTIIQTFRNKMGASFHQCLTQRRLIAAKNLILEGKSLEDVSVRVGFSDYSTFFRAFKKEYGISPRQFRSQMFTEK